MASIIRPLFIIRERELVSRDATLVKTTFYRLSIAICLLAAPLFAARGSHAADWPVDRGDAQRTGVTSASLPAAPELLWKYKTADAIEAGVAIAGGWVYGGSTGNKTFCLDLKTGKPRWEGAMPGSVYAPPCIWNDRVIFTDGNGTVLCQDTQTTKTHWKFEADAEIHSSPIVVQGRLLFGSYDQRLYCLDPLKGTVTWKYETDGPVHGSPTIAGDKAFVAGCDQTLRGIWITSGSQAWGLQMEGYSAASPAALGNTLYVGHFAGKVLAVDANTGKPRWEFTPAEGSDFPFYASCAATPEYVIAGGRDKIIHCLDRETGKRVWKFETKGDVDAAPVVAGAVVWAPSKDGTLYALDLKTGRKIWEYVAGVPLAASPAVADGKIVLGDMEGTLYCFGAKE